MRCEDLFFSYGKKEILNGIGFCAQPGKILAIVGDNGCGKTTLLKLLGKFLKNNSGKIDYENKDTEHLECAGIFEVPHLWPQLTGLENLQYYLRDKYNYERVSDAIKSFNLDKAMSMKIKNYSLGMQQKLAIILSIATDSSILLYDEPTNSLDQDSVEVFYGLMREEANRGRTIVLVTHVLSELENRCDRILFFRDKKLISLEDESEYGSGQTFEIVFDSTENANEAIKTLGEEQIVERSECKVTVYADCESISEIIRKLCVYNIMAVYPQKKTIKMLYKEMMQK